MRADGRCSQQKVLEAYTVPRRTKISLHQKGAIEMSYAENARGRISGRFRQLIMRRRVPPKPGPSLVTSAVRKFTNPTCSGCSP